MQLRHRDLPLMFPTTPSLNLNQSKPQQINPAAADPHKPSLILSFALSPCLHLSNQLKPVCLSVFFHSVLSLNTAMYQIKLSLHRQSRDPDVLTTHLNALEGAVTHSHTSECTHACLQHTALVCRCTSEVCPSIDSDEADESTTAFALLPKNSPLQSWAVVRC
jgi:hypothetical protein